MIVVVELFLANPLGQMSLGNINMNSSLVDVLIAVSRNVSTSMVVPFAFFLILGVAFIIRAFLPMKGQLRYCSNCGFETQQFSQILWGEHTPFRDTEGYICDRCGNKTVETGAT